MEPLSTLLEKRKIKTDWQREHGRKMRALLNEIKSASGCVRCGYNEHPAALDFNHIDPSTKTGNIAERCSGWGEKRLRAEVAKCEILCANCHRIHSYETHYTRMGTNGTRCRTTSN